MKNIQRVNELHGLYTDNPLTAALDNLLADRLGRIALEAGSEKRKDVGDNIDRGLILLRLLTEQGFAVTVPKPTLS